MIGHENSIMKVGARLCGKVARPLSRCYHEPGSLQVCLGYLLLLTKVDATINALESNPRTLRVPG